MCGGGTNLSPLSLNKGREFEICLEPSQTKAEMHQNYARKYRFAWCSNFAKGPLKRDEGSRDAGR